jgi:hypothetical protein
LKATTVLGNRSAGAAAGKRETQDVSRHTARAAASHLSPAELTKRDQASVDEDGAALARVQASRALMNPLEMQRYAARLAAEYNFTAEDCQRVIFRVGPDKAPAVLRACERAGWWPSQEVLDGLETLGLKELQPAKIGALIEALKAVKAVTR